MTSGLTQYLEKKVLDQLFGNQTPPTFSTLYFGCCTGGCVDAGTVTGEPTIGEDGYARVAVTNSAVMFPNCTTDGSKATAADIEFPACDGDAWGTITTVVIFDAATSGHALAWYDLTAPKTIQDGDILRLPAGDQVFTLD